MKKAFALAILALVLAVLSPPVAQAQGTTYVSSLGLPSTGSASVGSDSWVAEGFWTGPNAAGYLLNSVQLVSEMPWAIPAASQPWYTARTRIL